MKISIFGLGYVGAVSVACLARDGHEVIGVDIDSHKLDLIRAGRSPIVEEGIQELMRQVVDSGRVRVTDDSQQAVAGSELSFICVGTPSSANGSQDLTAILRLAEQIGAALATKEAFHVIVVRSTVQPGTVEEKIRPLVEARSGKRAGPDFALAFQPEFLREGTSIRDYDTPPFTIVGSDNERAIARLRELFGHLPGEFLTTRIRDAEALKMACNAFHALKIAFANEMGRTAQALGADAHEIMRLLCRDTRLNISTAYMRPGFAFGGSCLPKDLRALTHLARTHEVDVPLLASLLPSNRVHIDHAVNAVLRRGRRRVGMLGLSFKPGTDDLRESPLVTVAKRLIGEGYELKVFDPEVNLSRLMGANRRYIDEHLPHIGSLMCASLEQLVGDSEIIIVGLAAPALNARLIELCGPAHHVIDLVRLPERAGLRASYEGICW
jgi:GDP-mannose 6-dehydrogenase